MKATWVQPVKTTATPVDASRAYRSALAVLMGTEPEPKAVAVMHAHGALETGNFASCWNGNAGNVKAGSKYEGLFTTIKLNEYLSRGGKRTLVWFDPAGELTSKNGTIVPGTEAANPPGHAQCRMRAYRTLTEGIRDKIRFLLQPHWKPALNIALTGNAGSYVKAIAALGYFTSDIEPYMRAVVSLTAKLLPVAQGVAAEPEEWDNQTCVDVARCMRTEIPDWLKSRVEAQVLTSMMVDWGTWVVDRDANVKDRQ